MKQILIVFLLIPAVIAGLMMPDLWLVIQDKNLEAPQITELSDATLDWVGPDPQAEFPIVTGEEVVRRLRLIESGASVMIPLDATTDEALRISTQVTDFLNMLCEAPPDIHGAQAEYILAWFEPENAALPHWTAFAEFNHGWSCLITIDGESGAILQCIIIPNENGLDELFPVSFTRSAEEPDTYFESLIAQRFCDTLSHFMGSNNEEIPTVWTTEDTNSININFTDASSASFTGMLYVDLMDGILFNHP